MRSNLLCVMVCVFIIAGSCRLARAQQFSISAGSRVTLFNQKIPIYPVNLHSTDGKLIGTYSSPDAIRHRVGYDVGLSLLQNIQLRNMHFVIQPQIKYAVNVYEQLGIAQFKHGFGLYSALHKNHTAELHLLSYEPILNAKTKIYLIFGFYGRYLLSLTQDDNNIQQNMPLSDQYPVHRSSWSIPMNERLSYGLKGGIGVRFKIIDIQLSDQYSPSIINSWGMDKGGHSLSFSLQYWLNKRKSILNTVL